MDNIKVDQNILAKIRASFSGSSWRVVQNWAYKYADSVAMEYGVSRDEAANYLLIIRDEKKL